jgi:hypothetical protein
MAEADSADARICQMRDLGYGVNTRQHRPQPASVKRPVHGTGELGMLAADDQPIRAGEEAGYLLLSTHAGRMPTRHPSHPGPRQFVDHGAELGRPVETRYTDAGRPETGRHASDG